MHHHGSLREHLAAVAADGGEPTFELTDDPTLVAFAALFELSELIALDANKRLRTDAWSPSYECWTESLHDVGSPIERFEVTWTPAWARTDPLTGFRVGWDSALLGSTPTVAMPQDERTAALLMLVTTAYVHLSASRDHSGVLVRGAVDAGGPDFRYLMLDPAAVGATAATASPERPGGRGQLL